MGGKNASNIITPDLKEEAMTLGVKAGFVCSPGKVLENYFRERVGTLSSRSSPRALHSKETPDLLDAHVQWPNPAALTQFQVAPDPTHHWISQGRAVDTGTGRRLWAWTKFFRDKPTSLRGLQPK